MSGQPWEPWMGRWVLWAHAGGNWHVIVRASTVGSGIVGAAACGRHAGFGLRGDTYYCVRHHVRGPRRFCRECVAVLSEAGESGPLRRREPAR